MAAAARALACFTFDNMGEAAEVGTGSRIGARADGADPSLARGFPRLYELLADAGVRATFFVEGWNGVHHPDAVAEIVGRGHELGMHGWVHEAWAQLAPDDEEALAARATEALTHAAGVRPRGFRAPGGSRTSHTATVLRRLGYRYDASLGDGMRRATLAPELAQIPFVWPAVDGFHYLRPEPDEPAAVRSTWLAALERVARDGGLFLLVCHAFITGTDEARLTVLGDVLRAAVGDARIAVHTAGEIADMTLADRGSIASASAPTT